MTLDDLHRALASGDEHTAWRAIRAAGESLREGRAGDPAALHACLTPLASHRSPLVRQAVADVCDALPDASFDEVHARLLADADRYVRAAAEAAGHRHAKMLRREAKKKGAEERVAALLTEIERASSKEVRRLAERAVEHGVEGFATQLDHEVSKTQPSIRRALDALERELGRPERSPHLLKDHVATVRERARFAYAMIRRARDYAERAKPVFADEALAAVVNEARAQLVDRLGPRAAKLAFTNDVDPALRIEADRYLLMQALQNVLQNAAEAYREDEERLAVRVSASARRGGSEVVLVVADDGGGIPDERRETMFVPFKSLKVGGSGLGLLIVRRSVEEVHGGVLSIESDPERAGKGTRVTMILPARQARR
jgi:signal transduction histidine kinase